MSIRRFALAAGLLLGQVSANTPAASSPPASSQAPVATANCRTELGTSSVKVVPTTTITRTIHDRTPVVVLSTILETVTVTPAVSTEIVTDYETTIITSTADAITDTFSTTSTEFDTATLTLTPAPVTITVAEVFSSTSTSTSTIATSAGFTPIVDTLPPSVTYKRSLEENEDCSPWVDDWKYPQAVVCHEKKIIKTTTVSTIIGSPVTSTAATPTTRVTIINTITSSSVIVPSDVSTTLSFSATSTITETTSTPAETTTVTSTTTVLAGTTTTSFYAACATNNIAGSPLSSDYGPFAGKYIYALEVSHVPGQNLGVGNTDSAYHCCVTCITDPTCAFSYYYGPLSYCYVTTGSTCSAGSNYGTAYVHDDPSDVQISNGYCGHVKGTLAAL
ncbi:hypothetical protein N7517_002385 [Penicillium concentricum]|uniref:Apple domain-containing protein n=1 Tax=Penicillium concentricum TaxID=293559 RepID=A0A9W9VKQ8_9EURO|nr:uncharacterized protein N7517_002385 [Penicillium concentricum]KAJ5384474.1 hypothetical protein N7517_002385 [Penicillium concentricum]